MKIQTNIEFLQQVKKLSGVNLKECMQCGNCTAVCKLNNGDSAFPRKEMMWSAWGLKDKLIGNPALWQCHQCGDCSTTCPRNVKPANVLSALRELNYLEYSRPVFLAKWLSKPAYLPLVIIFPVIIIHVILYFAGTFSRPVTEIVNYSDFFPHAWLNSTFTIITLLFYSGAIIGLNAFWNDMKKKFPGNRKNNFIKSFIAVFKEVMIHKKFKSCETSKFRSSAHFLVFWGFISLLAVTVVAIFNVIFFEYPMRFWHPAKVAGNIASLMLFVGLGIMIFNRLFNKKELGKSNYFDWYLLISFFLLTLSGTLTEMARFLNWQTAYIIYTFHLVMVWLVFIYAPFSKFGHMMYRTVALVYLKSVGK